MDNNDNRSYSDKDGFEATDDKTTGAEVNEPVRGYGGSGTSAVKLEEYYTYADYCSWEDDGTRWELIDGVPYMMGAPNRAHQKISSNLHLQFATYLKGKPCEVYHAPFDVRLNADDEDDTVVQPDILIVCDEEKLKDGKSVVGAPDLAVEILSPSSSQHDKVTKFNAYRKAGIKEYWIVDPDKKILAVNILQGGSYITRLYPRDATVPVHVLDDCEIDLSEVFEG